MVGKLRSFEETWVDGVIYYIEFTSTKGKKISKAIVLGAGYTLEEVEAIIKKNFNYVEAVNHIDIWEDCLSLK